MSNSRLKIYIPRAEAGNVTLYALSLKHIIFILLQMMYTTRFYTKYITIHINQRLVENTRTKLLFLSLLTSK